MVAAESSEQTLQGPEPVRHVYLHVPFCSSRCSYCDFPVTAVERAPTEAWLAALSSELKMIESEGWLRLGGYLETVYVGGGTPSFLGPDAMESVRRLLGPERLASSELEWTVEANPDSFSNTLAKSWSRAGVNRVSMGVQSFQPSVLRFLNRLHGPNEARAAIHHAREAGIQNLNLDLMFGLPPVPERDWKKDLDEALALAVPHLSLYGLSVEKGTPLAGEVDSGAVPRPSEEQYREEFLMASERLALEGYTHYEVSNFARAGYESRHNRAYWGMRPYLGLGSGAHSFGPPRRKWNVREWAAYQRTLEKGIPPRGGEEELMAGAVGLENLWLGLRTDQGVGTDGWGEEALDLKTSWVSSGYATHESGTLRLTPEGWLLLDHLVVELDRALNRKRGTG